jgi:hypothetical protein
LAFTPQPIEYPSYFAKEFFIWFTTIALCAINQFLKQEIIYSSRVPLQCAAGNIYALDGMHLFLTGNDYA